MLPTSNFANCVYTPLKNKKKPNNNKTLREANIETAC